MGPPDACLPACLQYRTRIVFVLLLSSTVPYCTRTVAVVRWEYEYGTVRYPALLLRPCCHNTVQYCTRTDYRKMNVLIRVLARFSTMLTSPPYSTRMSTRTVRLHAVNSTCGIGRYTGILYRILACARLRTMRAHAYASVI